ncbi:MAG: uracil-DNA glycosylase [Clostridiales bacterium]|jgi:uracil-DNA glycosylase|nr:uracil-DNA glycosylase [Clostridiales bacterium]
MVKFDNDWDDFVANQRQQPYYLALRQFLKQEYFTKTVYPPMDEIFSALRHTSYADTKVVILGQDPYINPGEAHGMAFSVRPAAKIPPSLRNIFIELCNDLDCTMPNNGFLMPWAMQGVLLLNTVLTVEAGRSKSHAGKGWEQFTDSIITRLSQRELPMVFMLWGRHAQQKAALIDTGRHRVLTAVHPSPLAGGRFFGCKHFSAANAFLAALGAPEIDWQIPNL